MKREPDYSRNNKLVASNQYIKAIHPDKMNLNAMKLFRFTITQCRLTDEQFYEYQFKVRDLAREFQIPDKDMYRDIKSMCIYLMQMILKIETDQGDWELKHIFETAKYEGKTGTVTLQLHKDMTALFLQLKTNFTRIPIVNILSMRSKYAIRIYELICEKMLGHYPYADEITEIDISLEEIRQATGTTNKKTYKIMSNLKNIILYPALKEIEQVAAWKIIVEDIKTGRSITGFHMTVWSEYGYRHHEKLKAAGQPEELVVSNGTNVQMNLLDYNI